MRNLTKLGAVATAIACLPITTLSQTVELDLIIGYPNEGKVNVSPKACAAFVKEAIGVRDITVGEFDKAVTDVCAARLRHFSAYDRLRSSYKQLVSVAIVERRIQLSAAVERLKELVKTCIDFKQTLRFGGHQYHGDIIENTIAADCLNLGSDLLRPELARIAEMNAPSKTMGQPTVPIPSGSSTKPDISQTSYIGKWYSDDKSKCKGRPGEPGSPLVYTAKKIFGWEFACDVVRVTPHGRTTELSLSCSGEGESYKESETVEVVDGQLRRTAMVNGKRRTFSYFRCP